MDLSRFVDLYVSETQEHIGLLHRSLITLESDTGASSISEAFRAAHTIKGLSAAMGYGRAADEAHRLEDRLAALRDGGERISASLVDELLSAADALEQAVSAAPFAAPDVPVVEGDAGDGITEGGGVAPAGTATIVHVALQRDAPMKAVRGMLIVRALAAEGGVLGTEPQDFDDSFQGQLQIFLAADADVPEVEARIRSAGDVATIREERVHAPAVTDAARQARTVSARQVRVEESRLHSVADSVAELSVLFARISQQQLGASALEVVDRMGTVLSDLEHDVRALRMVPLRQAFERLPRVVRDAARASGRDVELVLAGEDVELDRTILDEITEPLVHLLRNAVDHGIEPEAEREAAGKPGRGLVRVAAQRERGSVSVTVTDDGRGVSRARVAQKARAAGLHEGTDELDDDTLFRLMCQPGLSTADTVTTMSGRGVGLDVVASRVRALGGALDMQSREGVGTTFTLRLPIVLALAQALRVRVGGEDYAIPLTHVMEAIELADGVAGIVSVRARPIRIVRLRRVLQVREPGQEHAAVIAGIGDRRAALAVDELIGREQIVVRSFDAAAGTLPYFSGATLLADGRAALVLDPLSLL